MWTMRIHKTINHPIRGNWYSRQMDIKWRETGCNQASEMGTRASDNKDWQWETEKRGHRLGGEFGGKVDRMEKLIGRMKEDAGISS